MASKMKTHKGARKRLRVSATGKVRHQRAWASHLMSGKSGSRRRALDELDTQWNMSTPLWLRQAMARSWPILFLEDARAGAQRIGARPCCARSAPAAGRGRNRGGRS